jgi:hypothetical protein
MAYCFTLLLMPANTPDHGPPPRWSRSVQAEPQPGSDAVARRDTHPGSSAASGSGMGLSPKFTPLGGLEEFLCATT